MTVWDLDSGTAAGVAHVESGQVTEIGFSTGRLRLAVAERAGRITLLDASTLTPVGRPVDVGDPVAWVAARPDDRTAVVLTGGPGESTYWVQPTTGWALVDLVSGEVVRKGRLRMASARWLDVSPDGRFAAVSGGDNPDVNQIDSTRGVVELVDLSTGESRQSATTTATVQQVAWSPDGTRLISASHTGAVTLWDADDLTVLQTTRVEERPLVTAEFLPDGRSVRILDWLEGTALTWNLEERFAVDFACRAVGRDLTPEEWRSWFGDRPQVSLCDATS